MVLQIAQQRAADVDRLFPLSLGAEGSCTIGGNLSDQCRRHRGAWPTAWRARWRSGWKWCWPMAAVLNGLSKLKKDNTGYDLRNLFIGAEGTLGIITAATLKLFPKPRAVETAYVGLKSPAAGAEAAVDLAERGGRQPHQLRTARRHRGRFLRSVTASTSAIRLTSKHPWYVLMELSSSRDDAARRAGIDPRPGHGRRHRRRRRDRCQSEPARRRSGSCATRCRRRRSRKAARSSTTSRCRSPPCPPSSKRPMRRW